MLNAFDLGFKDCSSKLLEGLGNSASRTAVTLQSRFIDSLNLSIARSIGDAGPLLLLCKVFEGNVLGIGGITFWGQVKGRPSQSADDLGSLAVRLLIGGFKPVLLGLGFFWIKDLNLKGKFRSPLVSPFEVDCSIMHDPFGACVAKCCCWNIGARVP